MSKRAILASKCNYARSLILEILVSKGKSTSWEPVHKWYDDAVGKEGHYYHQQIILPGVLRLLNLKPDSALLDIGCGQGVLARKIPENIPYVGVDSSAGLLQSAKKTDQNPLHEYVAADATEPLLLKKNNFTHAAIILALQNMERPLSVLKNIAKSMVKGGKLIIVLNHPCFRIPRQSSWQVDAEKKVQYRRIDRYNAEMKIPIHANPSKGEKSPETWSFHHPLSAYTRWLKESGFCIEEMEEWCSDKVSTGAAAKMENRSRAEIPLFLAIVANANFG
jgi:ubiquinone/menaquinone biosynthesis C-methylase UbiE